jgi:hypothetical protein
MPMLRVPKADTRSTGAETDLLNRHHRLRKLVVQALLLVFAELVGLKYGNEPLQGPGK